MEENKKRKLTEKGGRKSTRSKKGRYQRRVLKFVESVQECERITERKQSYG